jgi:hypothetical protein
MEETKKQIATAIHALRAHARETGTLSLAVQDQIDRLWRIQDVMREML